MKFDADAVRKEIESLIYESEILVFASADKKGNPHSSFCPFVYIPEDKKIYVLLSQLSGATANIEEKKEASIVIMENAPTVETIFSHERVRLQCDALPIMTNSGLWDRCLKLFENKYKQPLSPASNMLEKLHLVELKPFSGRFVLSEDQIFDLEKKDFSKITPLL